MGEVFTTDNLQTIQQLTEKTNEHKKKLTLPTVDYEKAFETVEYQLVFKALRH